MSVLSLLALLCKFSGPGSCCLGISVHRRCWVTEVPLSERAEKCLSSWLLFGVPCCVKCSLISLSLKASGLFSFAVKKPKILISNSEMSSVIIGFVRSAITSNYDTEQTPFQSQDNSPLQLLALSASTSHAVPKQLPLSLAALKAPFLFRRFLCFLTVFLDRYETFCKRKSMLSVQLILSHA